MKIGAPLAIIVTVLIVATPSHAADVQRSELFETLARRVLEKYPPLLLAKTCDTLENATDQQKASCKLLVSNLTRLVTLAAQRNASDDVIVDELRRLGSDLLGAALSSEGADVLASSLTQPAANVLPENEVRALKENIAGLISCTTASFLGGATSFEECPKVKALLSSARISDASCSPDDPAPKLCSAETSDADKATCLMRSLLENAFASHARKCELETRANLALKVIGDVLRAFEKEGGFLDRIEDVVDEHRNTEDAFSDVEAHAAFSSTYVDPVLALAPPAISQDCSTDLRALLAVAEREKSFADIARATMTGNVAAVRSLADAKLVLPTSCQAHQAVPEIATWTRYAQTYAFMTELHASIVAQRLPAVLVASLIDFVGGDEDAFLGGATRAIHLAIEQSLAASEKIGAVCTQSGDAWTCVGDGASRTIKPANNTVSTQALEEMIEEIVVPRFTSAAVRETCVGQAVAAVLDRAQPRVRAPFGAVCRRLGRENPLEAELEDLLYGTGVALEDIAELDGEEGLLARWKIPAHIRLARALDKTAVDLSPLLTRAAQELPSTDVVRALAKTAQHSARRGASTLERGAARIAMQLVRKPLLDFVDDAFTIAKHPCGVDDVTLRCVVHDLTGVVAEPFLDALLEGSGREELARRTLAAITESRLFEAGPLLVNAGLGATALYAPLSPYGALDRETVSLHLTVLDKWGWRFLRFGDREQGHVALFAGGFLDAIVRTAAGNEESARVLAGITAGCREVVMDVPIGVEAHLAWAPPIDVQAVFVDARSLATIGIGVALTVPLDDVLTE